VVIFRGCVASCVRIVVRFVRLSTTIITYCMGMIIYTQFTVDKARSFNWTTGRARNHSFVCCRSCAVETFSNDCSMGSISRVCIFDACGVTRGGCEDRKEPVTEMVFNEDGCLIYSIHRLGLELHNACGILYPAIAYFDGKHRYAQRVQRCKGRKELVNHSI
jgi:hypothetical protein